MLHACNLLAELLLNVLRQTEDTNRTVHALSDRMGAAFSILVYDLMDRAILGSVSTSVQDPQYHYAFIQRVRAYYYNPLVHVTTSALQYEHIKFGDRCEWTQTCMLTGMSLSAKGMVHAHLFPLSARVSGAG